MPAYFNDRVLDNGLSVLSSEATHIHLTKVQVTSYANLAAQTVGSEAVVIAAPSARTPSGRKVTVAAISGADIDAGVTAQSATHYTIEDATNDRILVSQTLASAKTVSEGDLWNLATFDIGIPGASA